MFSFPGIPISFFDVLNDMDEEGRKDLLQECNENLSRAFFDKNGCKEFWKITEITIKLVKDKADDHISIVYENLISLINVKTQYLTKETLLYMISLVKTGLENAN